MNASNPKTSRWQSSRWFWIALSFFVGLMTVLTYSTRFSPASREARVFLQEMPVDQIQEIRIEPYTVSSLTDQVIVIRDREKIRQIAALFRALAPYSPNHPHARWLGYIRFQLADRQYGGQFEATDNQGGLFWMSSNVQGGWNYGCYRNDSIGPFFELLVAQEKARR